MKDKTVLLIDGHSIAYRAFYALPELSGPDGTPTNAILGFFNMFFKTLELWKPDRTVVVFDSGRPTFRHKLFEEYKQGRRPTPDEFKVQLPILQEMLKKAGVTVAVREGIEADDVIASGARTCLKCGCKILALTSDKDLLQIIEPGIVVIRPQRGVSNFRTYDENSFFDEYGFFPRRMVDYLALVGDRVDNVPGVPGIGDKTARKLLMQYGDIDSIMDHIDELKPAMKKRLTENMDVLEKSRFLVKLKADEPIDVAKIKEQKPDLEAFYDLCNKYGLRSLPQKISGQKGEELSQLVPSQDIEENLLYPMPPLTLELAEEDIPDSGKRIALESLLQVDELACGVSVEGNYPMSLVLRDLVLVDRDGRYWHMESGENVLPVSFLKWLEGGKLLTADYKMLCALFPDLLADSSRIWDLSTAHYLLHPDAKTHSLESIIQRDLNDLCVETRLLWNLREKMAVSLRERGLEDLMCRIDMPLIPVLVEMERYGVGLDMAIFAELSGDLGRRLEEIEQEIATYSEGPVNLNSPKQVAELLFDKLGLPPIKKTKTGYSTNVTVLEELSKFPEPACIVPRLLLEYRELAKLLSGFAQPLVKAVNEETGCIHTTFESTVTGTGRLSSRDPNLQNLPAYGDWSLRLRKGLIPHGQDRCFVAADYSQIELRVLAHICGEQRLIDAFASGRDIHTETASWVFRIEPELVTPELRRYAKMVNFGILYGMSSFGLAQRLDISRGEAANIIKRYFEALPRVLEYIDETNEAAKNRGYTQTLFGRIRPLDEVSTINGRGNGAIKRVIVNSPIQGTAADIAKLAMIRVADWFKDDPEVNMILQVHDSIVCECPLKMADQVERNLCNLMEGAFELLVPLKVESKCGMTMGDI